MKLLRMPRDATTSLEKVRFDVVSARAKNIPIQNAQWAEELLGDLTYEDVKGSNSVAALMFKWSRMMIREVNKIEQNRKDALDR